MCFVKSIASIVLKVEVEDMCQPNPHIPLCRHSCANRKYEGGETESSHCGGQRRGGSYTVGVTNYTYGCAVDPQNPEGSGSGRRTPLRTSLRVFQSQERLNNNDKKSTQPLSYFNPDLTKHFSRITAKSQ